MQSRKSNDQVELAFTRNCQVINDMLSIYNDMQGASGGEGGYGPPPGDEAQYGPQGKFCFYQIMLLCNVLNLIRLWTCRPIEPSRLRSACSTARLWSTGSSPRLWTTSSTPRLRRPSTTKWGWLRV